MTKIKSKAKKKVACQKIRAKTSCSSHQYASCARSINKCVGKKVGKTFGCINKPINTTPLDALPPIIIKK